MAVELSNIFNSALENSLFLNKSVLQSSYNPSTIPHREKQIEQIASILAPSLRGEKVSNLFVYGKTGTGKTLSILYVKDELLKKAKEINANLRIEYLNCKLRKVSDTEYRILAALIEELGGSVPATGLPTQQVYNKFVELIDSKKQLIILILDEVDQVVKRISDSFLYSLLRLNSELSKSQISLIGISNDVTFLDNIDPRVRSSLGEEEILFPTYNALQLQDILRERSKLAFKENVVDDAVISKCAALAAREHGDARRALDLLRIAGELAEREGKKLITLENLDMANEKIERDKILDLVESQPIQCQVVLYSIIVLTKQKQNEKSKIFFTGDVYNIYSDLCKRLKLEVLTQRRVSDIIADFDMFGLINAVVISKGRHGRTREIKLSIPQNIIEKVEQILKKSLSL
ncbi:MAG: orc1/cdc6 family replication initiation protein [Candidatus Pacearchaeota archaeon]